jgi:hypothetical protein
MKIRLHTRASHGDTNAVQISDDREEAQQA